MVCLSPYNRLLEHFVSNEIKTKFKNGNFAYGEINCYNSWGAGMRYYIADCHFYHKNLLTEMDNRDFESVEQMNEVMIEK